MKTIYKYPLDMTDIQHVALPVDATILTVQVQHGLVHVWALVDPDEQKRINVTFRIYGTGHPIDGVDVDHLRYLGTVQLANGDLIFHIFEESR